MELKRLEYIIEADKRPFPLDSLNYHWYRMARICGKSLLMADYHLYMVERARLETLYNIRRYCRYMWE